MKVKVFKYKLKKRYFVVKKLLFIRFNYSKIDPKI